MISFGRLYVANDNVVERIQKGLPFNQIANVTDKEALAKYMYSHLPDGYTDVSVFEAKM